MSPGALVLGASYRALGVVRSLGRRGVPVRLLRTDEHRVATFSRYAEPTGQVQDGDEATQVGQILALARTHGLDGWSLVPTDDDSAHLVSRGRDVLTRVFRTTTAPWETLVAAHDKRFTYALGQRAGVPVPQTWTPQTEAEVAALAPRFPVILKPSYKVRGEPLSTDKAWRVESAQELQQRYREARRTLPAEAIVVQELVPGGDGRTQLSYGALCRDGEVLASITACRVRQRPMDFGKASTYVESIADADVEDLSRRLLAELGYTGIIEVEFKRDARDGQLKLLDMNPRTWGWQSLGAAAGVDFPWLDWLLGQGEPVPEAHAHPGVRWVRVSMDLPLAVAEVRAGRMRAGAVARTYRPPLTFATFTRDDPRPAFADLPLLVALAVRRRLRSARPR